jgi:hypothetical protein
VSNLTAPLRAFDLTGAELARRQSMRSTIRFVRLLLGTLLTIGGVGMLFAVPRLVRDFPYLAAQPDGLWTLGLFGAILIYIGVVVTLLFQSIQHSGKGPIRAEVGSDGFTLSWPDGCRRSWVWDHLRGSIHLTDLRESDVGCEAEIQLSMAGSGWLSGEACDAIVQSARDRGLSVRIREYAGSAYIARNKDIVIRRVPMLANIPQLSISDSR